RAANAEVRALAALLGKTTGSTLTAIVAVGARAAFVHIGDSRAYLLRQGELSQLTEDHTLLARLEKMRHPLLQEPGFLVPRSYLYRSLGQEDAIDLDSGALTLAPGDRLLLCSDGLWDEVDGGRIAGLLAGAATAQEGADALVRAANDHGGNDNSSVVVVFVGEQSAIA
ncbi:MAG TPA: SpoIIE family protein phosphatase, partial [Ktedonobacterales bacterium]